MGGQLLHKRVCYRDIHIVSHTDTHTNSSSEVFLVEVEAEVFTLSFDDFGESRRSAVKHVDFPFILLRHLLEYLTHTHVYHFIITHISEPEPGSHAD